MSLTAALLMSAALFAQYTPRQGEWLHFSYSYLMMLNKPTELTENWRSNAWQMQILNERSFGIKSHLGLGYGLGISNFYYHNNLRISTNAGNDKLNYTWLAQDSTYNTNRFSATYLDVPIELRYRSNTNKYGHYFRFYVGALVGVRINSFSHFRNNDYSVKNYRINDMAQWHYAVFVRTGFWLFNLYACYSLSPTFTSAPTGWEGLKDIHSLQLGISLSL